MPPRPEVPSGHDPSGADLGPGTVTASAPDDAPLLLPLHVPAQPPARLPLPRGATLGRYVVLDLLGAGGMGVVYAAYDFGLDRRVSLKLVRGDSGPRAAERKARLLQEAQALARLSHPNVVTVHDVGAFDGDVFIAMELVAGGTVARWLRERERSWREVVAVFAEAAQGLAAAHGAGLVHRDFKPDNMLRGADGRVRVTDFGLAIEATEVEGDGASGLDPLRPGRAAGTPGYMAPEQLRGEPLTPAADQFSFCVALYEALYRQRPFPGRAPAELRQRIAQGPLAPPAGVKVPAWLEQLVLRGLRPEPAARHPSMLAIAGALHRRRPAKLRPLAAGFAAGALAGIAVGAIPAALAAFSALPRVELRVVTAEEPSLESRPALPLPTLPSPGPEATGGGALAGVIAERPAPAVCAPPRDEPSRPSALAQVPTSPVVQVITYAVDAPAEPAASANPEAPPSSRDQARRLVERLRDERATDEAKEEPLAKLIYRTVEKLARMLDANPEVDGAEGTRLAVYGGVPPVQGASTTHPWGFTAPTTTTEVALNDVRVPAVDTLERSLQLHIDAHRSAAEIAEARFALAQALWATNRDTGRALQLAAEAKNELNSAGNPELVGEIDSWLEDKIDRRQNPEARRSDGF